MLSSLILMPLIGLIIVNLPLGKAMKKLSFWLVLLWSLWQACLVIFPPAAFTSPQGSPISVLFPLDIQADSLTLVMLLSIAVVAFTSIMIGWFTIKDEDTRFNFANLLMLAVAGMNGIVLVKDIFSLYVFLEITAVSSYILIALQKDKEALEGAFKYLILSAVATAMMLSAIALLMMTSGGTSFEVVGNMIKTTPANIFTISAVCLFTAGLLIKAGIVPFHGWLPDSYASAPAGASVLLAGIVTKTTGVYTIIRLVTAVFGYTPQIKEILLFTGALSIVAGALAALGQKDMKRMLAYSSISQVGYIIISLGAGTPLGLAGAVFHLFNHSIFKSQLFANAAAVEEQTGTRDMDKLGGIAEKMPFTGAASVIAFLSTAGIPPLSGFWSKLIIIIALWSAGYYIYAMIAVAASIITIAYFLSMQRRVFFGKLAPGLENLKEAKAAVVFPAVILALITIGVGIFFPYILNTFILPVKNILN